MTTTPAHLLRRISAPARMRWTCVTGAGFPLVLAHGYCTSMNLWRHQIPLLAQRYQVIAYDARGHGLSSSCTDAQPEDVLQAYATLKSFVSG